ncbi:MAG TPA: FAD-dependent oxidoreductase [Albitalea sp.]|uniref:FAD-dependent oxidoreductase n=1 Tax=Piscinibacter sp. TaxID=1903157 RepID=UPI002ED5F7BF
MAMSVAIAGAGLLGRLLAWRLARRGWQVDVFDPAPGPGPRFGEHGAAQHAAGFSAAGMLSPLAELENADAGIAARGWRSIALWREIVAALDARPDFAERGSLMLAHRADLGAAHRVLARLPQDEAQPLDGDALPALEPSLQRGLHAWLLPGEAHIDAVHTLAALQAEAPGARWHWQRAARELHPGRVVLDNGDEVRADRVFDVRGLGARPALPLRGVRGEMLWLRLASHGLTRPVRLLHPRHRVYVVPRSPDLVLVGASEIESEDRSEVSLRSAVELMAAAHSVMPSLAEARVVCMDSNLRPALADHRPYVEVSDGLVRINGLFRHGWLLAPALIEEALG